ncbi:MAG: atpD, partial [Candidatus Saccharibacteria bacterium]|nr:atpD [Candidatus Saccharibacteria bacterium]
MVVDMATRKGQPVGEIAGMRALTVEVKMTGEKPQARELLDVEGVEDLFLEVNYFRNGMAICLNLNNTPGLRVGQKVSRGGVQVTVPVGENTTGRVFNA